MVGKELFLIGGYNYKEGTIPKCEKFSLLDYSSSIIKNLPEESCNHSLCDFRNNFIFKIGGHIYELKRN